MQQPSLREDRRVRRTKTRLCAAFTELLREKPFQEITVREIADRADVNRGTFYGHYKDIYDMLEQIENDLFTELSSVMDAYDSTSLRAGLRPILRDAFRFVRDNAALCSALMESQADDRFFQRLNEIIFARSARQWSGLYPGAREPDGHYTLNFLVAGVVGMVRTWALNGFDRSTDEMAALAERLILRGIGPEC